MFWSVLDGCQSLNLKLRETQNITWKQRPFHPLITLLEAFESDMDKQT